VNLKDTIDYDRQAGSQAVLNMLQLPQVLPEGLFESNETIPRCHNDNNRQKLKRSHGPQRWTHCSGRAGGRITTTAGSCTLASKLIRPPMMHASQQHSTFGVDTP
jgi:hypothetical protein